MKAITLTQHWATLVALGEKRLETRSWTTRYRGPLAIHAAKEYPGWAKDHTGSNPLFVSVLGANGVTPMPRGAVVAVCQLIDVYRTEEVDPDIGHDERGFSDYTPGLYVWVLADALAFPEPIPAIGALGLWDRNDPDASL